MGHALGPEACLVWYLTPKHYYVPGGARQEGRGHRRAQSGMTVPVLRWEVLVGRGGALSPAI